MRTHFNNLRLTDKQAHDRIAKELCKRKHGKGKDSHQKECYPVTLFHTLQLTGTDVLSGIGRNRHTQGIVRLLYQLFNPACSSKGSNHD